MSTFLSTNIESSFETKIGVSKTLKGARDAAYKHEAEVHLL